MVTRACWPAQLANAVDELGEASPDSCIPGMESQLIPLRLVILRWFCRVPDCDGVRADGRYGIHAVAGDVPAWVVFFPQS